MRLDELLGQRDVSSIEISGVSCDSRTIEPGFLFIAIEGGTFDGHRFVDDAIERGAIAILTERPVSTQKHIVNVCNKSLVVERNRLAARFYDDPSKSLQTIGITGTNGKTSVAYGLASVIPNCGFAGSLGWGGIDCLTPSGLTTMDGAALQGCMASMRSSGMDTVAMEVSSHALAQHRLQGVEIDVGVFTNLTRDHLDYHGSMSNYAAAKQKLFEDFNLSAAIVNGDDEFGCQLINVCQNLDIPTVSYGSRKSADVSFGVEDIGTYGARGVWRTKWGDAELHLPVRSEFGVMNCAAILAAQVTLGQALPDAAAALEKLKLAPGRFEFLQLNAERYAVIDFAHTPDALKKTLGALGDLNPTELVCVFGCGGDRDPGKRECMGRVAELQANRIFVTNDNPRTENPERIAEMILQGFDEPALANVILNRRQAITEAIESLAEGGIVLIAGKGVEPYQEINGVKKPFSDHAVVRSLGMVA